MATVRRLPCWQCATVYFKEELMLLLCSIWLQSGDCPVDSVRLCILMKSICYCCAQDGYSQEAALLTVCDCVFCIQSFSISGGRFIQTQSLYHAVARNGSLKIVQFVKFWLIVNVASRYWYTVRTERYVEFWNPFTRPTRSRISNLFCHLLFITDMFRPPSRSSSG